MTDGERETYMDAAARIAGLTIPDPCRTGVLAQLALFLRHAGVVATADSDSGAEPAELLRP